MKKAKFTIIAGLLLFQTGAMAQVYVKNTGNVGIGINTPADKLHVTGNLRLIGGSEFYFEDLGQLRSFDDNHRILFRRNENVLELREYGRIIFSAGAVGGLETTTMVVNNDGNVGVGVTYPAYKLDVVELPGLTNSLLLRLGIIMQIMCLTLLISCLLCSQLIPTLNKIITCLMCLLKQM